MLAATCSIMYSARQVSHVSQRKYRASVVAAETTSEAAVGLLGVVTDSFSFEMDFELLGLFQLIKEGKDS